MVGSDNTVYALYSETGEPAWQKAFPNPLMAPVESKSMLYQLPEHAKCHARDR